jgi:signal transduction histidine kinase
MKKLSNSIRAKFTLIFISILCFSCIASLGIVAIVSPSFSEMETKGNNLGVILLLMATLLICAVIGSILMIFATKFISKPIKYISDVTKEIAKGNFDVEIQYKSHDEIGVLAKNFNLMTKELKNMEYLRKDFMSNVSHEFKTPIASIQGFVEIIKDENLSREKFDEYTDIILEETKRLNNLSSNILRLSRLDNQIIQNKKTCFSLDEQLRRTLLLFEEQWSKRNLELEINLEKVIYEGYEELVQQIWINLIGNAIKFSYDYGCIYISLKEGPKSVVVEIRDEGIGISEESKQRIFEKFYQGDTSRSESGNGLGLAIVKKIIEICDGTIVFESKAGQGTRFTVTLPI